MVENLLKEERRVGKRKKLTETYARLAGVSERTIRNWKREYLSNESKILGRPKRTLALRIKLLKKVKKQWLHQGKPGWRPVAFALKGEPIDLIQLYVAQLKKKDRKSKRVKKIKRETRVKVLFSGAVWTQDATFFKKRVYAEVIKDRCSLKVVSVNKENNLKKENVVRELKKHELPLVYMTDNGSAYCSKEMSQFLKEKRVIHLKSLPRTPQNNGCCEIAVREVKELLRNLDSDKSELQCKLDESREILNTKRLRKSLGYRTSEEVEKLTELKNKGALRDKIYSDYEIGLLHINESDCGKLQKRKRERELIFSLLENYGLIKRYRGGQNYVA